MQGIIMMQGTVEDAAKIIAEANHVVALTGAGISVESGIPAFRGSQGLWDRYDPTEYAHISSFTRRPEAVWVMLKELYDIMQGSEPNPAHLALAELEEMGILKAVVTQNVDGLHQRAGSKRVLEFHGTGETLTCLSCHKGYSVSEISLDDLPPRCSQCSGVLKPDVVFFGEPIPPEVLEDSFAEAKVCDCMLVIGTSAQVYPAAQLPYEVQKNGGHVIEFNMEATPLTHSIPTLFLEGSASITLPKVVEELKRRRGE